MQQDRRGLDEMQRAYRDKVGNQCFILLAYLLMLNAGLYGFGVRWIEYPASVMAILMLCLWIYLLRIIAGNAYFPPASQRTKVRSVLTVVIAIAASIILVTVLANTGILPLAQGYSLGWDSALFLLIMSAVALVISLAALGAKALASRQTGGEE